MLRDAAVLLVVTMHERVPERTPDAQAALQNIVRAGRRLVLGGLSREDVGRLIELTSGVAAGARARATRSTPRTEGNPFFAREILALLLAEGRLDDPPDELPLPDGVRETIRRRLEPLDERRSSRRSSSPRSSGARFTSRRSSARRRWTATACSRALDAAAALGLVDAGPGDRSASTASATG